MARLTLQPELVPRPLWGHSAYQRLDRGEWRRLRATVMAEAGGRCRWCGHAQDKYMVCHELWDYDYDAGTATLRGLVVNCPDCDAALHFGLAGKLGRREVALAQLMRVNHLSRDQARRLVMSALRQWKARSGRTWHVLVHADVLQRHPILACLEGEQ